MPGVPGVPAMPPVQEHVKQGAEQQQAKWQETQDVRPMLGDEQEADDAQEAEQHPTAPGSEAATSRLF